MTCNCKQLVHRACWLKWVTRSGGPVCIICRKGPEEEEESEGEGNNQHEIEFRVLVLQRPPRGRRDCRDFFWWLLLFYFIGRIVSNWVIAVAKLPPR